MTPMVDYMITIDADVKFIGSVSAEFFELIILTRYGDPPVEKTVRDGYRKYCHMLGQQRLVIWTRSYNIG